MDPDYLDSEFLSKCANIDINSYKQISWSYGYDKNWIYYWCYKTQAKDIDNFKVIDRDFWQAPSYDKNYRYPNFLSADKDNVYFQWDLLTGMSPDTLRLVKSNIHNENLDHIQDDKSFTCGNQYFTGINWDKLIINYQSGWSFIKDDKKVFTKAGPRCRFVAWADPKTFKVYNAGKWVYKDKNNVYIWNKKIAWADPKTFLLDSYYDSSWYAKDKKHVYYYKWAYNSEWQYIVIKWADPKTFKLYNKDKQIYKDKKNKYQNGKIIK